jgi:hypothetical protein
MTALVFTWRQSLKICSHVGTPLAADRNETHNLAEKNPDVAKRLGEAALSWRKSLP